MPAIVPERAAIFGCSRDSNTTTCSKSRRPPDIKRELSARRDRVNASGGATRQRCGAALAAVAARGAEALLFGLTPHDPVTFIEAIGVLAGIALVACSILAFRASRVDATAALRPA